MFNLYVSIKVKTYSTYFKSKSTIFFYIYYIKSRINQKIEFIYNFKDYWYFLYDKKIIKVNWQIRFYILYFIYGCIKVNIKLFYIINNFINHVINIWKKNTVLLDNGIF